MVHAAQLAADGYGARADAGDVVIEGAAEGRKRRGFGGVEVLEIADVSGGGWSIHSGRFENQASDFLVLPTVSPLPSDDTCG